MLWTLIARAPSSPSSNKTKPRNSINCALAYLILFSHWWAAILPQDRASVSGGVADRAPELPDRLIEELGRAAQLPLGPPVVAVSLLPNPDGGYRWLANHRAEPDAEPGA